MTGLTELTVWGVKRSKRSKRSEQKIIYRHGKIPGMSFFVASHWGFMNGWWT